MIKLTRNALTMLLAHYRAIYRNAYIKGALAAVAAAGLGVASTAAQADFSGSFYSAAANSGGAATISAEAGTKTGTAVTINATNSVSASGDYTSVEFTGDLTVSDGVVKMTSGGVSLDSGVTVNVKTLSATASKATSILSLGSGATLATTDAITAIPHLKVETGTGTLKSTDAITTATTQNFDVASGATLVLSVGAESTFTAPTATTAFKGTVDFVGTWKGAAGATTLGSGSVSVGANGTGSLTLQEALTLSAGDLTVANGSTLTAASGKAVKAQNITVNGTLTSSGDIKVSATAGNLTIGSDATVTVVAKKNLSLNAAQGTVSIGKDITLTGSTAEDSGAFTIVGKSVVGGANLTTAGGSADIKATSGAITLGNISAGSGVTVSGKAGTVSLGNL